MTESWALGSATCAAVSLVKEQLHNKRTKAIALLYPVLRKPASTQAFSIQKREQKLAIEETSIYSKLLMPPVEVTWESCLCMWVPVFFSLSLSGSSEQEDEPGRCG